MIDFHCHLDLFPDPAATAASAEVARVYVLSVTTTPKAWSKSATLSRGKTYIRTALGIHPQVAHERFHELPLFESLINETRYVGEIGLDGSPGFGMYADVQKRVFERVLAIAKERGGKILTIHSRRAVDDVLAALKRNECENTSVLHWFSGTHRQLYDAISLGCWFSVGPIMLRSEKGRSLVALMPRNRILTETDGPFALDKGRPLQPTDVQMALAPLSKIWAVDKEQVERTLKDNLRVLLDLVPSVPKDQESL